MDHASHRAHHADTSSVDDGRHITPNMMIAGAALALLAMAATVLAPRMWGIDPYGPDTDPAPAGAHSSVEH